MKDLYVLDDNNLIIPVSRYIERSCAEAELKRQELYGEICKPVNLDMLEITKKKVSE